MTLPGEKQVWRIIEKAGKATADLVCLEHETPNKSDELTLINILKDEESRVITKNNILNIEPLLVEIIKDGKLNYEFPSIQKIRELREKDLGNLDFGVKRLIFPHTYQVSISPVILKMKKELLKQINRE
jgi:nicotinate phosphoribosyltransferase